MVKVARGKALVAKLRADPKVRDAEALAAELGRKKALRHAAKKAKEKAKASSKVMQDVKQVREGVKKGVTTLDSSGDMDDWDIRIRELEDAEGAELEPFTGTGWVKGDDILRRLGKAFPEIKSSKQFNRLAGRKDDEDSALGYNIPTDTRRSTEDRSKLYEELAKNWNRYIYGDKKRRGGWEARPQD